MYNAKQEKTGLSTLIKIKKIPVWKTNTKKQPTLNLNLTLTYV